MSLILGVKSITTPRIKKDASGTCGNGVELPVRVKEKHRKATQMEMAEFLTPYDLHRRWSKAISLKTLANWRSLKLGPPYSKIGGRVLYKTSDIIFWESEHRNKTN